jgi:hypothetical protein
MANIFMMNKKCLDSPKIDLFLPKNQLGFCKSAQNSGIQHFVIKQTPPKIKLQVGSLL